MAVQGLWVIPAPALSCCDSHTGTARVSLHCVQRRPWACSNPHKTPLKPALFCKSGFEMLISGFIKLLTLVMSQVVTTQVMSSLLSEAALHSTSQQPLHKPLGCCFSRFMATKSPVLQHPWFSFTSMWIFSTVHPCLHPHPEVTVLPPKGTALAAGTALWWSGRSQPCPARPRKCMAVSSPALKRCFGSFAFVLSSKSTSPACKGAFSALCAWCGGDKAPTCSQGVCAGSFGDAQSSLHVLVSFSLGEFEKQQQAFKFGTSEADLRLEHREPLSVFLPQVTATGFTLCLYWCHYFKISSND